MVSGVSPFSLSSPFWFGSASAASSAATTDAPALCSSPHLAVPCCHRRAAVHGCQPQGLIYTMCVAQSCPAHMMDGPQDTHTHTQTQTWTHGHTRKHTDTDTDTDTQTPRHTDTHSTHTHTAHTHTDQ